METKKQTKKALRELISESINKALASLQLPVPSKKIRKLVERDAKKLASVYADILKHEEKKKKKAEKFLDEAVNGKVKNADKVKLPKAPKKPVNL